jgi:hypothetical protein
MRLISPLRQPLYVVCCVLLPMNVFAQAACNEVIAEMDRRIATGNYSDQLVNMAQTIRGGILQVCSQINETNESDYANYVEDMAVAVEDILQTQSDEERLAARRERRAAEDRERERAQAERDKQVPWIPRPAKAPADVVQPQLVFAVLKAAPTAKSVSARFVDRPDNMFNIYFQDHDVFEGRARILYETVPSVPQYNSPDWLVRLYVAEIGTNGVASQRLIVSDKDTGAAPSSVLRRGYDEVIRHSFPNLADRKSALERWSISGTELVSSAPVPNPPWPDGNPGRWYFGVATSDGNVLYTTLKQGKIGTLALGWLESSPDGIVLGRGSIPTQERNVGYSGELFETNNGGAGIVFNISSNDNSGMSSPEKRFLITSNDATTAWESVAIERLFDVTNNRMTLMIGPTADGYAVLSNLVANTNLQPPVHGPYLLELDASGMGAKTYLNPIAEQLDIRIKMFDVSENNEVYLLGTDNDGRGIVVLLDGDGEPKAYGRATLPDNTNIQYEGMLSDASGVWLYGDGSTDKVRLWVERIEFP